MNDLNQIILSTKGINYYLFIQGLSFALIVICILMTPGLYLKYLRYNLNLLLNKKNYSILWFIFDILVSFTLSSLFIFYSIDNLWKHLDPNDSILYNSNISIAIISAFIILGFTIARKLLFKNPSVIGFSLSIVYISLIQKTKIISLNGECNLIFYCIFSFFFGVISSFIISRFSWSSSKNHVKFGDYSAPAYLGNDNMSIDPEQIEKALHILGFIFHPMRQSNAVNIGLNGSWGSGKTTVINIVRSLVDSTFQNNNDIDEKSIEALKDKIINTGVYQCKKDECVRCNGKDKNNIKACENGLGEFINACRNQLVWLEFNPFFYSDAKEIRKGFFKTILLFLKKTYREHWMIWSYCELIANLSLLNPLIGLISNAISEENDQQLFQNIAKTIRNSFQDKVVIVIDDLDRLKADEILEGNVKYFV